MAVVRLDMCCQHVVAAGQRVDVELGPMQIGSSDPDLLTASSLPSIDQTIRFTFDRLIALGRDVTFAATGWTGRGSWPQMRDPAATGVGCRSR